MNYDMISSDLVSKVHRDDLSGFRVPFCLVSRSNRGLRLIRDKSLSGVLSYEK